MKQIFSPEVILQGLKELLWLTITGMITFAVLYPITSKLYFLHWKINAVFIVITITYFRYFLTFRSLPFLRPAWFRFILFTVNLSLFLFLWHHEQRFISMADNFYTQDFGFPKVLMFDDVKRELFTYISTETLIFGTGSLIMIAAFQLRLILSYWQYYKYKAHHLMEG